MELNGLLGQSGFLEALYIAKLNSDLDSGNNQLSYKSDFGCKAVAWYSFRIPLCPCQLARMRNIPLPFNEKVRIQHCCDYWLGRALQGEGKGKSQCLKINKSPTYFRILRAKLMIFSKQKYLSFPTKNSTIKSVGVIWANFGSKIQIFQKKAAEIQ